MKKHILLSILLHTFLSVAILSAAGETMKLQWMGAGARSLALGNTGTAIEGLSWAAFYNPASVSMHSKFSFTAENQFLALDRQLYFASLASEISGGAGVGFLWAHSSVSDVEARDIDGELTGTVSNSDNAVFFAFGRQIVPKLHLGVGFEYFQRDIENITTSSAGFGAGISFRQPNPHLTLGASIQNLFMELSWNSGSYYGESHVSNEKVPIIGRIGASYIHPINGIPVHLCSDIWKAEGSSIYYGIGLETELFGATPINAEELSAESGGTISKIPRLALRIGIDNNRLTGGAGIYARIGRILSIGVDYAIVAEKEGLPPRHIIDLTAEY